MQRYGALDPAALGGVQPAQTLSLYRLVRAKYANLSGIGAALYPGRWNQPGVEAIYTSVEIGTTLLERLVHTPKSVIPQNLALMRIELVGRWSATKGQTPFFASGNPAMLICPTYEEAESGYEAGDFGSESATVLAVALPSVIAPVWNVVLYPKASEYFSFVSLKTVDRLDLDGRLFPTDAEIEAAEEFALVRRS